jgi:hypothetical protein
VKVFRDLVIFLALGIAASAVGSPVTEVYGVVYSITAREVILADHGKYFHIDRSKLAPEKLEYFMSRNSQMARTHVPTNALILPPAPKKAR